MKTFRNAIIGFTILFIVIAISAYGIFIMYMAAGCNELKQSGNGSIIRGLGKEIRDVKDRFNEGYQEKN